MLILVSGEGPTDIGRCIGPEPCVGADFEAGSMAWLVDQIAEAFAGYPFIASSLMLCVSKQRLSATAKNLKPPTLPGKHRGRETAYFFRNARALAQLAAELSETSQQPVVAVLFRDADGTQSAGRGEWRDKWNSMCKGFGYDGFQTGVPMIPNPKSEAWLLCAVKATQPYEHCAQIEQASGNDAGSRPLKMQLEEALGEPPIAAVVSALVQSGNLDASRIRMPSFVKFRTRLLAVLKGTLVKMDETLGQICGDDLN